LAKELDELKPKDGETVVWKKFPGSFAQTELQKKLGDEKKLVLTGYMVCCAAIFPRPNNSKVIIASFLGILRKRQVEWFRS
jgi:hypothetical protein